MAWVIKMKWIILLIFIILLAGLIACGMTLLSLSMDWSCYNDREIAKLTFCQFKSIYDVIPDSFCLHSDYVTFKYESVYFKTFFDYLRYKIFYKHKEKYRKKIESIENQAKLIKNIQEELARQQRDNDQWVKENIKKNVQVGQTSF